MPMIFKLQQTIAAQNDSRQKTPTKTIGASVFEHETNFGKKQQPI